jgi:hypothetical protein
VVKIYKGKSASGTPVQSRSASLGADGAFAVDAAALADGDYTAQAEQRDAAGNVGHSAARSFSVDASAPETSLTSGPSGSTSSSSASFSFDSSETGSRFECRLDGGAWESCTSAKAYSDLSEGDHSFAVRAIDAAGNVDATPATRTLTVNPVAFTDGFESGDFSKWTTVRTAIDGAASVQTGVVANVTYAAYITAPSATSYAYIRKTLSASQADVTVSGDFDITVEGISGQEVPIFKLYDASTVRLVYLYRRNVSGRVYVVYNGTTYPTSVKIPLGTWEHFAVHTVAAGAGASTIEVTMNGASIYATSTASLGTSGIRVVQVGNDKQLPFALYADNIEARI